MKTTKSGKRVRLHFKPGGTVDEAKNIDTGATHTPAEFAADRARSRKTPRSMSGRVKELRGSGYFGGSR